MANVRQTWEVGTHPGCMPGRSAVPPSLRPATVHYTFLPNCAAVATSTRPRLVLDSAKTPPRAAETLLSPAGRHLDSAKDSAKTPPRLRRDSAQSSWAALSPAQPSSVQLSPAQPSSAQIPFSIARLIPSTSIPDTEADLTFLSSIVKALLRQTTGEWCSTIPLSIESSIIYQAESVQHALLRCWLWHTVKQMMTSSVFDHPAGGPGKSLTKRFRHL